MALDPQIAIQYFKLTGRTWADVTADPEVVLRGKVVKRDSLRDVVAAVDPV